MIDGTKKEFCCKVLLYVRMRRNNNKNVYYQPFLYSLSNRIKFDIVKIKLCMKRSRMIKDIFYARKTTIFSHKFWFVLFLLVAFSQILAMNFSLAISNDDTTITLYDNHDNQVGFCSYKKIPKHRGMLSILCMCTPNFVEKGMVLPSSNKRANFLKIYTQPAFIFNRALLNWTISPP